MACRRRDRRRRGARANQRCTAVPAGHALTDHQRFSFCNSFEVGSGNDHRMTVGGAGDSVGKRNCDAVPAERRLDLLQERRREGLRRPCRLRRCSRRSCGIPAQLGLHVHVEVQHGGGHGGGHYHGQQSRGSAPASEDCGAHTACAGTSKCAAAAVAALVTLAGCGSGALMHHLAARTPDQTLPHVGWPPRFRQRSPSRRSPG